MTATCRVLKSSTSGYYEWRSRGPSARDREDAHLIQQLRQIHDRSRQTYGVRRCHAELRLGSRLRVGHKRVWRLLRLAGLQGVHRRRWRHHTPAEAVREDRLQRKFSADRPDKLWFTDITEHRTAEGWVYCAAVLDVCSRRIVGWSIADHLRTELVVDALEMARWRRGPSAPSSTPITGSRADSTGRRNTSRSRRCAMARRQQQSDRALRPSMRSPGRPIPARQVERAFWRLIAQGKRTEEVALELGVSTPVAVRWFRHAGGMPPVSLAEPSGRYLSFAEHEKVALLKAQGLGVRAIAHALSRDPGTVSRELRRNVATRSGQLEYRASVAQWKAQVAARRPKPAKLASNPRLREYVQARLSGQLQRLDGSVAAGPATRRKGLNKPHRGDRRWATAWSLEQISRRLVLDFPDDEVMRISHEAIYQAPFIEGRGALKRELVACLRTGRALRKPRERSRNRPQGHVTPDVVLSERPAEADDRAVPGH